MSHTCSGAIIRCMDFRLTAGFNTWMEENGIMNDADIISIAGVVKSIADNPESSEAKYLIDQIKLSKKLHHIDTLYIVHHTDCGAYGGSSAFTDTNAELKQHIADMESVKSFLSGVLDDVKIKLAIFYTDESKIKLLDEI